MKSIFIIAAVAAGAVAQTVPVNPQTGVPTCAEPCIQASVAKVTNCGATDYTCQCSQASQAAISADATTCVINACTQAVAINDVLPASEAFCQKVLSGQFTLTSSASSSTSSSASGSSSSSATTTSSASTTMSTSTSASSGPTSSSNTTTTSTPSPVLTSGGSLFAPLGSVSILALVAWFAF